MWKDSNKLIYMEEAITSLINSVWKCSFNNKTVDKESGHNRRESTIAKLHEVSTTNNGEIM